MKQTMPETALILENQTLRAEFSGRSGALLQIEDRACGFSHLSGQAAVPFSAIRAGARVEEFERFHYQESKGRLELSWQLPGAVLHAVVRLLEDGLAFRFDLQQQTAGVYQAVEYPVIGGLVSQGERSLLAHPWATGVLMRDPASFLPEDGALRYAPYPECFSGAPMQMMTYFHKDQSGLYLVALDGRLHQKWLNAYTVDGALCLSHMYGFEDLRPGADIRMDYDFVLQVYEGKSWEQAAERYRGFALAQTWCPEDMPGRTFRQASWLREEVGYCTFGINAGYDRSHWLKRYREDIGCTGFHVLGPDWTNKPQTFDRGVPGGMADWLHTRFNAETLSQIKENGDRFAPFEFDFLVSLNQSDQELLKDNLQQFPLPSYSHDTYHFSMLCPAQPFTKSFHRERDVQVWKEAGIDAMYYDISANNLIKICTREDHHHTPGGGYEIARAYQDIFWDTRSALEEASETVIPLGSEQISEELLPCLDFYQARAWAQPASTLETWPIRPQMWSGQTRMIPLFDYVYHDVGPVRMDGWGKLVEETGELFYYTVAKVYLWGGIYQINHEYSPMEALEGRENPASEHYFRFDPQGYKYSPERARHLGLFAAARLGDAKDFWAYGRLLAMPELDLPRKDYTWYHYNHGQKDSSYKASGTYPAEAVFASLWQGAQGGRALFLANCDDRQHTLSQQALVGQLQANDAKLYRFGQHGKAVLVKNFGMTSSFPLEARGLYMLKI